MATNNLLTHMIRMPHHLNVLFVFAPSGNGASEKQLAGCPIGKHLTVSPGAQLVRFIPKANMVAPEQEFQLQIG